jgi:hypothetical protein
MLEARDAIGGTWDLFRYPGVRSDSDMHTLGYRFRPWRGEKAIADGPSILDYLNDTARGIRHRPEDPLSPQGQARVVVVDGGVLDARGPGSRRQNADLHLQLPANVQRLLRLRRRLHARMGGHGLLQRRDRAFAEMTGESRLRRQACRRDRQRRNRHHIGARDGGQGRARHEEAMATASTSRSVRSENFFMTGLVSIGRKFTLQAAAHGGHRLPPDERKGAQERTRNRVREAPVT